MSLVATDVVLGPPIMWAPRIDDVVTWGNMQKRRTPCPKFPTDLNQTPYITWRMEFIHWMVEMRQAFVCEALLGSALLDALKGGAESVHDAAVRVDPRIMGHPGRPRYGMGPQDPGELSGVVWYVESELDTGYLRKEYEYGRTARANFYKVHRGSSTTHDAIQRQERAYDLAWLMGDFCLSNTSRTDEMFKCLGCSEAEKASVLMQVRGDESRYEEIKQIVKDIYPHHKEKDVKIVAMTDAEKAEQKEEPGTGPEAGAGIAPATEPIPGAPMSAAFPPCSYAPAYSPWDHSIWDQQQGWQTGWTAPDPGFPPMQAPQYSQEDWESFDWGEGFTGEDGVWYAEIPILWQDWYSGGYWNQEDGYFWPDEDEQKEWDSWQSSSPEQAKEIFSTWPTDENPLLEAEEPEPGYRAGAHWLPIFFGRFKGKGPRKGGPSRKGRGKGKFKGGRKGGSRTKGYRPKGGKPGRCFICNEPGHWKGECPNKGKGKGPGKFGKGPPCRGCFRKGKFTDATPGVWTTWGTRD